MREGERRRYDRCDVARHPRTRWLALAAGVLAAGAGLGGVLAAGAATPKPAATTAKAAATTKAAARPVAKPAPKPGSAAARAADIKAGATLFQTQGCTACHALAAARSKQYRAPDLDALGLPQARIVKQLVQGSIGMPSFKKRLTGDQILQIALYITAVSKNGEKNPRDAATLYRGYCGMCHSLAGPGITGVTGAPLDGHGYTAQQVFSAIVNRHPLTQGFGVDLDNVEIQAIAAYVVTQQQGAPATTVTVPTITAQG